LNGLFNLEMKYLFPLAQAFTPRCCTSRRCGPPLRGEGLHAREYQIVSFSSLEQAIRQKSATVGVIGLGYIGLPLIRAFIGAGYKTMGFDVDQSKEGTRS